MTAPFIPGGVPIPTPAPNRMAPQVPLPRANPLRAPVQLSGGAGGVTPSVPMSAPVNAQPPPPAMLSPAVPGAMGDDAAAMLSVMRSYQETGDPFSAAAQGILGRLAAEREMELSRAETERTRRIEAEDRALEHEGTRSEIEARRRQMEREDRESDSTIADRERDNEREDTIAQFDNLKIAQEIRDAARQNGLTASQALELEDQVINYGEELRLRAEADFARGVEPMTGEEIEQRMRAYRDELLSTVPNGGRSPQQEQPAAQQIVEGTVIQNDQTGERQILRGGQWVPLDTPPPPAAAQPPARAPQQPAVPMPMNTDAMGNSW